MRGARYEGILSHGRLDAVDKSLDDYKRDGSAKMQVQVDVDGVGWRSPELSRETARSFVFSAPGLT